MQRYYLREAITFLLGLSAGGYVLIFLISDDIASASLRNTYMGFTNAGCLLMTPFLQPLVGLLLDFQDRSSPVLMDISLQRALIPLSVALFLSAVIAWRMPETYR